MYWADRAAQEIIASGKYRPFWVDDMKTPSGRIHVGSLRGVVVHDLVYRALLTAGQKATFSYVFEDHDPMDDIPHFLEKKVWEQYLGMPLMFIPSPEKGAKNYAEYFSHEFQDVFEKIGSRPKIIWASRLYLSGKMNEGVKKALDHVDTIRDIYNSMYEKKLRSDWYPFQPLCPRCKKISTTKVANWDGEYVHFTCNDLAWTKGCGFSGKQSPLSSRDHFAGKLSWKVEWALKWQAIGVTIEGGGKDHMTTGSSWDIATRVAKKVLGYEPPLPVAYEFFLVGGRKMSSSKGRGSSAAEVSQIMPPYLLRFLMVYSHNEHAIDFDPKGWTIPDLFDEYDKCWRAYLAGTDPDLARMFEFSQVSREKPPKKPLYIPRFRTVAQITQSPSQDIADYFGKDKGSTLTEAEKEVLTERSVYARRWLESYAPDDIQLLPTQSVPESATSLTDEQKQFLSHMALLRAETDDASLLQQKLFDTAKQSKLPLKQAFATLYTAFLGKSRGPRAGALLASMDADFVRERVEKIVG